MFADVWQNCSSRIHFLWVKLTCRSYHNSHLLVLRREESFVIYLSYDTHVNELLSRALESVVCCSYFSILHLSLPLSSLLTRAVLVSITWLHSCDKSACQQDIIIKLFQRSFNIAEEGLHFSPWKIQLKYNLCVRDELGNETFTEQMNSLADWNSLVMANCVTLSANLHHWFLGAIPPVTLPVI